MKVFSYTNNFNFFLLILQISLYFSLCLCSQVTEELGFCTDQDLNRMATLGGIKDSSASSENSLELDSLARFAVDEHNKKEVLLFILIHTVSLCLYMCRL